MSKLITAIQKTEDNKLAIRILPVKNHFFLQSNNDCQLLCNRSSCQFERRQRKQRKCQSQFLKTMLADPHSNHR